MLTVNCRGTNKSIMMFMVFLNIIQKVPESVIHVGVHEEQWKATNRSRGRWTKDASNLPVKVLHPNVPKIQS